MKKNIMFGICSYNRKEIIEHSASSLSRINDLEKVNVQVFDDHSNEYDAAFLHHLYPYAESIEVSEKNTGANANSLKMLKGFLSSSCEWLFIADSDLIYCESILSVIDYCIEEYNRKGYNGVISLFNTYTHPALETIDEMFCRKDEVGAAGVLVNREIVKMILGSVDSKSAYDVQFCKVLQKKGFDILCTNKSYVQHIGIEGYNSLYYTFDWGKDFVLDSMQNAETMNQIIDTLMRKIALGNRKSIQNRILEDSEKKRIGIRLLLRLLRKEIKQKLKGTK